MCSHINLRVLSGILSPKPGTPRPLQAAALTDWPWENKARAGKAEDAVCADCGTLDVCRDHKYCLCVAGEDGNKDCPLKDHNLPLRNVVINTLG